MPMATLAASDPINLSLAIVVASVAVSATAITIAALAIRTWRRARQSEQRAALADKMLARGMSAEEIARVLLAADLAPGTDGAAADDDDLVADPEVRIVQVLTANHYESDDVDKVLTAAREAGAVDQAVVGIVKVLAESWADADNIASVLANRRAAPPPYARAQAPRASREPEPRT